MSMIIAAALAAAAYLVVRALSVEARTPASAWREATFGASQSQGGSAATESALRKSTAMERLGTALPTLNSMQEPAQRLVEAAGLAPRFTGGSLIGTSAVLGGSGVIVGMILLASKGYTGIEFAEIGMLAGLLAVTPVVMVSSKATRRRDEIDRSLPDTMDLLVVSVEAGLALEGALQRVSARGSNPLTREIQRTLNEISLGRRRYDALASMGVRCQVQPLQTLVNAMNQAERTGMQMGPVLRAQSEQIRTRRRQIAEEKAMKAPLKMLFPLAFFIFPAMFLVILGPAAIPFL